MTIFLQNIAPVSYKRTDYNPTYVGLQAALNHQNPYSQAVTTHIQQMEIEDDPNVTPAQLEQANHRYDQPFTYPLGPTLFFLPYMLVPPEVSAFLARFVNLALYLLSVPLLLSTFVFNAVPTKTSAIYQKNRQNLAIIATLVVVAGGPLLKVIWPIIQLSGSLLFLVALIIFCLFRQHYEWAGAIAFLTLFKPQTGLAMLVIVGLTGALIVTARWRILKGFLIAAIPLTLMALWLVPTWITDWIESARKLATTSQDYQINFWLLLGPLGGVLIFLIVACLVGWSWWNFARHQNDLERNYYLGQVIALTIWADLVLIPRTGNYDLIFCDVALCLILVYCLEYLADTERILGFLIALAVWCGCSTLYLILDRNIVFWLTVGLAGLLLVMVNLHHALTKAARS